LLLCLEEFFISKYLRAEIVAQCCIEILLLLFVSSVLLNNAKRARVAGKKYEMAFRLHHYEALKLVIKKTSKCRWWNVSKPQQKRLWAF
jgi:hypothetical protein